MSKPNDFVAGVLAYPFDPATAMKEIMAKAGPDGLVLLAVTPAMIDAGEQAVSKRGLPQTNADLRVLLREIYEAMARAR